MDELCEGTFFNGKDLMSFKMGGFINIDKMVGKVTKMSQYSLDLD